MKVIVASTNPVKIEVAKQAFEKVFPNNEIEIVGVKSSSGVPDQPFDDEILLGAENRLKDIQETNPEADYYISQEGGLCNEGHKMFIRAWIVIRDKNGVIGKSSTASLYIPTAVAQMVREGDEPTADDKFFSTDNSKQNKGGLALMTDGLIDRTAYYLPSAIIALCQIVHKEWYS